MAPEQQKPAEDPTVEPTAGGERQRNPFRFLASHAGTVLAYGALFLYLVGVMTSVGQLRASRVDLVQGMQLIPLERHLLNGIGVVVSPAFLTILIAYFLMYVAARSQLARARQPRRSRAEADAPSPNPESAEAEKADEETRVSGASSKKRALWRAFRSMSVGEQLHFTAISLVLIYVAVTFPWPFLFLITLAVGSWFMPTLIPRRFGDHWSRRRAEIYVGSFLLVLVITSFVDAYFRSNPLPTASIRTGVQRVVEGPFIAVKDGFIHIVPRDRNEQYLAIPVEAIVRMRVRAAEQREEEPSLLNFLGLDWRP